MGGGVIPVQACPVHRYGAGIQAHVQRPAAAAGQ